MRRIWPYERKCARDISSATPHSVYTVGDLRVLFLIGSHCAIIRDAVEPAVCNRLR